MKHAVGVGITVLVTLVACGNDSTPTGTNTGAGTTTDSGGGEGTSAGASSTDSGTAGEGVDCTHPGAGKALAGGRCDCTTTRNVAGEWTALRTCREGDLCTTKSREETLVITQDGTTIQASRGETYSLTGVLCGDVILWSGGPSDGLNPECGQLRFSDDNHYLSDSCYVASGECTRTHAQGCAGLKGQCTGTGVKKPDPATPIMKVICN